MAIRSVRRSPPSCGGRPYLTGAGSISSTKPTSRLSCQSLGPRSELAACQRRWIDMVDEDGDVQHEEGDTTRSAPRRAIGAPRSTRCCTPDKSPFGRGKRHVGGHARDHRLYCSRWTSLVPRSRLPAAIGQAGARAVGYRRRGRDRCAGRHLIDFIGHLNS